MKSGLKVEMDIHILHPSTVSTYAAMKSGLKAFGLGHAGTVESGLNLYRDEKRTERSAL